MLFRRRIAKALRHRGLEQAQCPSCRHTCGLSVKDYQQCVLVNVIPSIFQTWHDDGMKQQILDKWNRGPIKDI